MSDQTLVVLNQGGGSKESVGIRIEREVNGVLMDGTPYLRLTASDEVCRYRGVHPVAEAQALSGEIGGGRVQPGGHNSHTGS